MLDIQVGDYIYFSYFGRRWGDPVRWVDGVDQRYVYTKHGRILKSNINPSQMVYFYPRIRGNVSGDWFGIFHCYDTPEYFSSSIRALKIVTNHYSRQWTIKRWSC